VIVDKITSELNSQYRDQFTSSGNNYYTDSGSTRTVTYTAIVGWDTNGAVKDSGTRNFQWNSSTKKLTYTTTGASAEAIGDNVDGFSFTFVTTSTDTKFVVYLKLGKTVGLGTSAYTITQEFREEVYLRTTTGK
jgi:hypothetical protein